MLSGVRISVLGAVAAALAVVAFPAQGAPQDDTPWNRVTASVRTAPADIVAAAPKGKPLRVEVTTSSAAGPVVESFPAASRAAAEAIVEREQHAKGVIAVGMDQVWKLALASNDPYRPLQWGLTTLRAEPVWDLAGGGGLRVAVIDTGVRSHHGDLYPHVVPGYNAITYPTDSTQDYNGHGTHVAGIIGALLNNSRGVVGLAPNSRIVPVKALGDDGTGYSSDIAQGIVWAANNNVRVINMSMAGTGTSSAVASAISYARSRNVVVVAAAGNVACQSGLLASNPTQYPAAYPGVVGVAAIDAGGSAASYSSCGGWVDIAAPGTQILSTMPSTALDGCGGSYCYASGTSMATAFVSAAALLTAQYHHLSGDAVVYRLLVTAQDLGTAGYDARYGYGLVNPLAAMQ